MSWTSEFQYKICYSKIKQIDTQKQVCKNFNTKFVIAKYFIIYKNILQQYISIQNLLQQNTDFSAMLSGADPNFNTKFVIAKFSCRVELSCLCRFQYKICYSKISNAFRVGIVVDRFQYKICYSKIACSAKKA